MEAEASTPTYNQAFSAPADVLLEDSWILEVDASDREVRFLLEVVLLPRHPWYRPPPPSEFHCCRQGRLWVSSQTHVMFRRSQLPPAIDTSVEPDFGHIDRFRQLSGDGPTIWELVGDWGEALIAQPGVTLELSGLNASPGH